ncbi:hypothetical protein WDZ92_25120 [Nostoc sp. NIES-2111]
MFSSERLRRCQIRADLARRSAISLAKHAAEVPLAAVAKLGSERAEVTLALGDTVQGQCRAQPSAVGVQAGAGVAAELPRQMKWRAAGGGCNLGQVGSATGIGVQLPARTLDSSVGRECALPGCGPPGLAQDP